MGTPDSRFFMNQALRCTSRSRSSWAPAFISLCSSIWLKRFRSRFIKIICQLEGGQFWSKTFRELLRKYYQVDIGDYSYGPCLWPGNIPEGTRIGRYCSFAAGIQILRRNHPIDRISQHPFFFNPEAGLVDQSTIPDIIDNPLSIGHDVWIGQDVVITPNCRSIGNAAIIAAGAVVTADVSPFAIVAGVPAKFLRWRFPEQIQQAIIRSQWWQKPVAELSKHCALFMKTLTPQILEQLEEDMRSASEPEPSIRPVYP